MTMAWMRARLSHNLGVRLLSVGGLLLTSAAVFFLISDRPEGATASVAYTEQLSALATASEAATLALLELDRGDAARPARKRVRKALKELKSARAWLSSTPQVQARALLDNALLRHREYLDAVGSSLANPRSPLRHRLEVRAERVRAAYGALPDSAGLDRVARGTDALLDYVKWRRKRLRRGS